MYITSIRTRQMHQANYNQQMSLLPPFKRSPFRKVYAVPSEHGSWIWWIGPLILGTAAAGQLSRSICSCSRSTMLTAFLIRQPIILFVKVKSGRRPLEDLPPITFWLLVYGAILAVTTFALAHAGQTRLFLLLLPGLPVFGWHLWLVTRREERGQRGIEIVGSGVLALAAPAAYWVGAGSETTLPWILWSLAWLQSAASIVLVYLRLEQRRWPEVPPLAGRLRLGARTLGYHTVNLVYAGSLSALGSTPWLMTVAFGLMLLDALDGVLRPAIGSRPTRIGLRQLGSSTLFFTLSTIAFLMLGGTQQFGRAFDQSVAGSATFPSVRAAKLFPGEDAHVSPQLIVPDAPHEVEPGTFERPPATPGCDHPHMQVEVQHAGQRAPHQQRPCQLVVLVARW